MNSLIAFEFESQVVRFVDGKPVANDVAAVLGYSNPAKTISTKVFPANRSVTKMVTLDGKMRDVTVLEEPGIYQLIFSSKLESAQKFQQWVFSEVLPSLRQNGQYSMPEQARSSDDVKMLCDVIDMIFVNVPIKPELVAGVKLNIAQRHLPSKSEDLEQARQLLIGNTAQEFELLTATEIGKRIGISAIKVNQKLIELGFQVKNENKKSKKDSSYLPTTKGSEFSDLTLSTGKGNDSTSYQQLRWYSSVINHCNPIFTYTRLNHPPLLM